MVERTNNCLACALNENSNEELGGVVYETDHWRVEHCTPGFGEGTMIVKSKKHAEWMFELEDEALEEFGTVSANTTKAIKEVTGADRVYTCMWAEDTRHVHFVLQPIKPDQREKYASKRGTNLQFAMKDDSKELDFVKAREIASQIRQKLLEMEGAVG